MMGLVETGGAVASVDEPTVQGTWNMTLQSHQVALVLEQNGKIVTGTLMIMGKDVPVDGEFVEGRLTLAAKAEVGTHDAPGKTVPLRLTATLQSDDTLQGEMSSAKGPLKWTAERLKPE
jgi:hypothetical protein